MPRKRKGETWKALKSIIYEKKRIKRPDLVKELVNNRGCRYSTVQENIKQNIKAGKIKIDRDGYLYLVPPVDKADLEKITYYMKIIRKNLKKYEDVKTEAIEEAIRSFIHLCKFKSVSHIPEIKDFFRELLNDVASKKEEKKDLPDSMEKKISLYNEFQEKVFTALWIVVEKAVEEKNKKFADKLLEDNKEAVKYFFENGSICNLERMDPKKAMEKNIFAKGMALSILAIDKEEAVRSLYTVITKMSDSEYSYLDSSINVARIVSRCYEYGHGDEVQEELFRILYTESSPEAISRVKSLLRGLKGR